MVAPGQTAGVVNIGSWLYPTFPQRRKIAKASKLGKVFRLYHFSLISNSAVGMPQRKSTVKTLIENKRALCGLSRYMSIQFHNAVNNGVQHCLNIVWALFRHCSDIVSLDIVWNIYQSAAGPKKDCGHI